LLRLFPTTFDRFGKDNPSNGQQHLTLRLIALNRVPQDVSYIVSARPNVPKQRQKYSEQRLIKQIPHPQDFASLSCVRADARLKSTLDAPWDSEGRLLLYRHDRLRLPA
jgi:hypothetical protein